MEVDQRRPRSHRKRSAIGSRPKPSAGLLEHARRILRGYNLVCPCPDGYPCHGSVLIELVNQPENES